MKHRLRLGSFIPAILLVLTVALGNACATKRYVRTQVHTNVQPLSERLDGHQQGIDALDKDVEQLSSNQDELRSAHKQNSERVLSLEGEMTTVKSETELARNMGMQAQDTADGAIQQITFLESKFENRNHYTVLLEEHIYFKFDSSTIEQSYVDVLGGMAQKVKQDPDAILVLEGHTDATGDETYNIRLGERRLDAVVRHLVIERDIPLQRLYQMSFGEAKPIASNSLKEGRAQNRSVVIRLLAPEKREPRTTS